MSHGLDKRCGNCIHWNGVDDIDERGDCPFYVVKTSADQGCERHFGKDQLRSPSYGRKAQAELFE